MTVYLLAGGGTAGHVNPLLATADRIRDRDPHAEVLVLGTAEGLESRLVPQRGYELLIVPRLPFPRRPGAELVRFPSRIRRAIERTRGYLRDRSVDVTVGFGGYAAAPAYLAAHAERVPVVVHEANSRPGLANRLGAARTPYVAVTFPGTRLPRAREVGLPLRREIETLDRTSARAEALEYFGLDGTRPVLLVTGGSTGARRINRTVLDAVPALLGTGWQVLHISGARDRPDDPGLPGYSLLPYCDRMDLALAIADLAVSRAGAATVCELAAIGVPAVFVPYPVGNGEQRLNARGAVEAGGARLVDDADFTPEWIDAELLPLMDDPARVAEAAARMGTTGRRDGADRMVELVLEAVDGGGRRGTVGLPR